jgi:hypothetical protein
MRNSLCFLLLAACELEPAPKQAPKPVTPPSAAAAPAPAPAPTPAPTPPPPPPPLQDACTDAAARYMQVQIAEAKDAQLKQNLEIERARTIGRIERGCREQKWGDDITGCYKAAKTVADLQTCTKKLQPVPAAGPPAKAPTVDAPTPTETKKDAKQRRRS